MGAGLEHKFARFDEGLVVEGGTEISGYASLFGRVDQGGDLVARGAYGASLAAAQAAGRRIKMLWQHDPAQPIGVWDELREDARGLWVKGRLLDSVARGREAAASRVVGTGPITSNPKSPSSISRLWKRVVSFSRTSILRDQPNPVSAPARANPASSSRSDRPAILAASGVEKRSKTHKSTLARS